MGFAGNLELRAGTVARERILEHGLTPDLVRMVVGASGGPKWLVLASLDKFLFGRWLKPAKQPIDLVGSSIGAWRLMGAAHPDVLGAMEKFHLHYGHFDADKFKTKKGARDETMNIITKWMGPDDLAAIMANKLRPLHIVATRAVGLASRSGFGELLALPLAAAANMLSRTAIQKFYRRAIFHSGDGVPLPDAWDDLGFEAYPLSVGNLKEAVLASSSIPGVIDAEQDLEGAPKGFYRDGGFTDYHFALPFRPHTGIVLYPHFYNYLVPGWFDKSWRGRWASDDKISHMLILAPSAKFVAGLPEGKIRDRKDFTKLSGEDRIAIWHHVMAESEKLTADFEYLLAHPDELARILESK